MKWQRQQQHPRTVHRQNHKRSSTNASKFEYMQKAHGICVQMLGDCRRRIVCRAREPTKKSIFQTVNCSLSTCHCCHSSSSILFFSHFRDAEKLSLDFLLFSIWSRALIDSCTVCDKHLACVLNPQCRAHKCGQCGLCDRLPPHRMRHQPVPPPSCSAIRSFSFALTARARPGNERAITTPPLPAIITLI